MKCRKCDEEIVKGKEEMIETLNYIFHFCLDCAVEVEGIIEDSLKTKDAKEEKK